MPDTKNVPIRWGKYIDHDMEDKKVMFIGAEKAIYGSDGRRLDEKLVDMEGSLSDAFSETKDYAVGEYCVYTNRVFKFTKAKTAGEWDGTAVIPVSLAQEISEVSRGIAALNSHFNIGSIVGQSYYTGSDGADANKINRYFTLCKGANLPDSNSFWFLQTIIFQIGADGFVERGKQIAYKYDGSQIYERHKAYDQTWTAWNGYATKSDLPTITKHIIYKNSADNEFMSLTLLNTGNIRATILMIANDSGSEYFSGVIRINMSSQVFIEKLHGNSKTPTVSITGDTLTLTNIGPRYNAFFASTREFVL